MNTHELEELRQRYDGWSTEELLRVVQAAGDYRAEAVQLARQILSERNVSLDDARATVVRTEFEQERAAAADAAAVPLSGAMRILCFAFCGIPGITVVAYHMSKGHTQREKDAWNAIGLGWAVRIALLLLYYLLG